MKYEAIESHSSEFSVRKMCKVLELDVSNYYRWKRNQEKRDGKLLKEKQLIKKIEDIFENSDRTYGYRVIKEELKQIGEEVSEYKVRRIMRENGMYPEIHRKRKPVNYKRGDGKYYDNVVNRKFKTDSKNTVWAGDITYIKTKVGWVYLAVVIDLYNREVIGYAISKQINTELVKRALTNAIGKQGVSQNLIFHSDRGSQYASKEYQKLLRENGITGSMSRGGCPYDNSCVESFFATLKKERIYRRDYVTIEDVKRDMFRYIELFYNRKRLHSILGYMSPVAYRLKYDRENVA